MLKYHVKPVDDLFDLWKKKKNLTQASSGLFLFLLSVFFPIFPLTDLRLSFQSKCFLLAVNEESKKFFQNFVAILVKNLNCSRARYFRDFSTFPNPSSHWTKIWCHVFSNLLPSHNSVTSFMNAYLRPLMEMWREILVIDFTMREAPFTSIQKHERFEAFKSFKYKYSRTPFE